MQLTWLTSQLFNPAGLFKAEEEEYNQEETQIFEQGEQQKMEEELLNARIEKLEATIDKLNKTVEDQVINIGNQPPRGQQLSEGPAAAAQFQGYFDWMFGAPGAKLPPPELRRADALYRAVTGDVEMHGKFDPSRVAFAAATTTTLADLAVNAMNKVVMDLYTSLTAYRWYELITSVQATDGTCMICSGCRSEE